MRARLRNSSGTASLALRVPRLGPSTHVLLLALLVRVLLVRILVVVCAERKRAIRLDAAHDAERLALPRPPPYAPSSSSSSELSAATAFLRLGRPSSSDGGSRVLAGEFAAAHAGVVR